MNKGIQYVGTIPLAAQRVWLTNRTGAATVKGGIYAIDISRGAAESTDVPSAMSNAVAVAAGNIDGLLVVAEGVYADDAPGEYTLVGPVQALVDGGTIDVAAGDKLIAGAASTSLTKSDATTDVVRAIACEANTGAAALKTVYFLGVPATRPGTDETP